ncbi:NAD-dependent epimerase/dehydratase family protein [Streptosporangium amethystogenes subsp. fukuiense]|uniref:NAD-dependent epimerase/dehydratase family protein n=1 Tax=Streptosporangium amethystogenes subsp. fukuiense TaxID=698418 RepID=A0ABW2TDM9_9ACTN
MEVFIVGASGYVGGAIADKLIEQEHQVVGLARSAEAAEALRRKGVKAHRGEVGDLSQWVDRAGEADAVVFAWLAPDSDAFRDMDIAAVRAVLARLTGSGKAFIYVTGSLGTGDTGPDVEVDVDTPDNPPAFLRWRSDLEAEIRRSSHSGVRSVVVRAPMVYGRTDGFIAGSLLAEVKTSGRTHYVGAGDNLLAFVHVEDLATLCARALQAAPAGALYLAANGESLSFRDFAMRASSALGAGGAVASLPLQTALAVMGPFAEALTYSQRLSSAAAEQGLGWRPTMHGVDAELRSLGAAMRS